MDALKIGKRISQRRDQLGLTLDDIANDIGVAKSTIQRYEKGTINKIKLPVIESIARKLNVSPDWLCCKSDDMTPYASHIDLSALSNDAKAVARDYSNLDQPGKNVVKVVLAEEGKRVKAEKERRRVAPAEPRETRLIPLYFTPAAAGMTEPAAGEDFDYLEVGPEVPIKADCAIKISGDSMEPYIMDKSIVYVTREPLENGDVGIFCVDGDMLCKQYYREDNGDVRLLSLNRARSDADRYIHRDSDTLMTYYGRVILPRRPIVSWA